MGLRGNASATAVPMSRFGAASAAAVQPVYATRPLSVNHRPSNPQPSTSVASADTSRSGRPIAIASILSPDSAMAVR